MLLRRRLATKQPAAYTPDLAASVHVLSVHLSSLGHQEEALEAIEEAVMIYRQLTSEQPSVFTPNLALALRNLAIHYLNSGFHQMALKTVTESVEFYRTFVEEYPAKFNVEYSHALNLLDKCRGVGGQPGVMLEVRISLKLRAQGK